MSPELIQKITESTHDVDEYLNPPANKIQFKFVDIETLADCADTDTLKSWFVESYNLLKEIQNEIHSSSTGAETVSPVVRTPEER